MPRKQSQTQQTVLSGTEELVAAILKELTENENFKSLLQNCVEKVITKKLSKMIEEQERQESRIFDLENKVDSKEEEIKALKNEMTELKCDLGKSLDKLNDLEQYSRRNCVRIFGVEERAEENPFDLVTALANDKLGLNVSPDDIDRTHRVGPVVAGKTRGIIVKFKNYQTRSAVIHNRRKLKGSRVVIKEDLTCQNQQLLKKTQNHNLVENAWSNDGKIFAPFKSDERSYVKKIRDLSDLDN